MPYWKIIVIPIALVLHGCAIGPKFETTGVDRELTPQRVIEWNESSAKPRVLWGGVIIATHNRKDSTQIEVLAYPLDDAQWPDQGAEPIGRFLARRSGFLEPVDYAQGRVVTMLGTVEGVRAGTVGETRYDYPLVGIEKLHLWPKGAKRGERETQFHFGIGVIYSR